MREIGVGIIGTGFMGKAHALAYAAVPGVYPEVPRPVLQAVADVDGGRAEAAAAQFGFRSWGTDWRALVDNPAVQIVSITTPNVFHEEMALAAAKAGKHIHCEKPLAPDAASACRMVEAAEAAGVVTQAGFNYLKNPLLKLAREMVATGERGHTPGFRGIHGEDFRADPAAPHGWRLAKGGGPGAIADIGSHIISIARYLLGEITEVMADV